jgi:hypothetical protein
MKAKLYILLVSGILILLVVAAVMTGKLFRLSVPDVHKSVQAAGQVKPYATPVSETYIEVGESKTQKKIEPAVVKTPAVPARTAPVASVQPQTSAVPAAVAIAVVIDVRGTTVATDASAERPRPLMTGSRIYLNEKIETVKASSVKIKFDDGTIMSQGENSSVMIDQYVYNPGNKVETKFGMYLIKGACHMVTGLITEINPERFKVRTRLATVGIRGCELAFRSKPEQDDIYILGLAGKENVTVDTTTDGRQMVNVLTKQDMPIEKQQKKTIDVSESGRVVSIVSGKGPEEHTIGLDETDGIMNESSGLTPALHNINLTPDGAVFTIQPQSQTKSGAANEVK